jgi:hypothetical protein
MKEDDLIKKLENAALPDIKLKDHQRRLRMALLDYGYRNRQRKAAIFESIFKGVKDTMIKGLVSRQPVWKIATVGLALVIILGLSITIPSLRTESVYAQAEEIAKNSASVKEALGGGEIQVVRIDISDMAGTGKVIAKGEAGSVLAEVDLKANKVMATFVADDQRVIEIAKADPKVKELLDSGATIGEVSTMYISGSMGNVATGEMEDISETLVMVGINGTEGSYVAYIDLAEGNVERLLKSVPMDPPSGLESFSIPDKEAQ